jgi:hypothetical protein
MTLQARPSLGLADAWLVAAIAAMFLAYRTLLAGMHLWRGGQVETVATHASVLAFCGVLGTIWTGAVGEVRAAAYLLAWTAVAVGTAATGRWAASHTLAGDRRARAAAWTMRGAALLALPLAFVSHESNRVLIAAIALGILWGWSHRAERPPPNPVGIAVLTAATLFAWSTVIDPDPVHRLVAGTCSVAVAGVVFVLLLPARAADG